MMKTLLLILVLSASLTSAQVVGVVTRVKIPFMSLTEMEVATPDLSAGFLFYKENTSELYLTTGDEITPYLRLNPDQVEWSHLATREVDMKKQALDFDDRYKLQGTGTYSEWTAQGSPLIRVFGNSLLVRVLSLDHDAAGPTLIMEMDTGGEGLVPEVQYCLDLTAQPQVWTEVENYTLDPASSGSDGRVTATISPHQGAPLDFAPYYRVSLPGVPESPEVQLLANTYIRGTLALEGNTDDDFETVITAEPTADRSIDLPDASGTVVLKSTQNMLWSIWAEESAGVSVGVAGGSQWSFGNGDNTPPGHGIVVPFDCVLFALSLNIENPNANGTVEVEKNGVLTGASVTLNVGSNGTHTILGTPVQFAAGDFVNFKTTASGNGTGARVAAFFRVPVSEVE